MKKILCLLAALMLCASLAAPAFAAGDHFVPSVTYKDVPELEDAVQKDENVLSCLVVTSVKGAEEKTTDISQEARDLLLLVYEELNNGTMELPLTGEYVVRELVDVSYRQLGCIDPGHDHAAWLAENNTTLTGTFDLGVEKGVKVTVLTYGNGKWEETKSVRNNGDGTVTVEFEHLCPVVFCVGAGVDVEVPKTGDQVGNMLPLWIGIMVLSVAGIVVLAVLRGKNKGKR